MNVNNSLKFIAELLRGDVQKRDHDGGGGHLKKRGVNFHQELNTVFGLHWPGEPKAAR
jgi:hypothetical protein